MDNLYYSKLIPLNASKNALMRFKTDEDKNNLIEYNDANLSSYRSAGGLLRENVEMYDFDGTKRGEAIHKFVVGTNYQCRESVSMGSHGGEHITTFANTRWQMQKQFTGKVLAIGITADGKCGKTNAYEVTKLNGKEYTVLKNESGITSNVFKVVNGGVDFTEVKQGHRTESFNKHLFALKRDGTPTDECFQYIRWINQYIIDEPMDESELNATVLNESTYEKLENMESENTKKDITLDVFKDFLNYNGITIKYNTMLKETEYYGLPSQYEASKDKANAVPIMMLDEFKRYTKTKSISKQTIMDYIFFVADVNAYNPIHEYFEDGSWDKTDRFPIIFGVLGVDELLHQSLIKKWFYQCVGMSYNSLDKPIQAEGCLILSGKEGMGKSRFFALMTPEPRWFRSKSNMLRLDNKDNLLSVISGFIVELGEIDATLSSKRADIKSFITASTDNIRKPYRIEEETTPRTTSFAGTTNKSEFLNDESGFRRWWHIPIKSLDKKMLTDFTSDPDELHQFWLQCYEVYQENNECFRLSNDEMNQLEEQNKDVMEMLPAEEELRTRLDFDADASKWFWVSSSAIKTLPEFALEHFNTREIGCAINRIRNDEPRVKKRTSRGIAQYLLPPCRRNMDRTFS